jgi:hypothetical protein
MRAASLFGIINDGGIYLQFGIVVRRFDQFQLFEAGGIWGPLEYLAFSSYHLDGKSRYKTLSIVFIRSST